MTADRPSAGDTERGATRARHRLTGTIRISARQLWHTKGRVLIAIIGVAVAVLLMTLMTGLGHGMTQAGTDALTYIDQDLWATAGPLELAPGSVGGVRNTLLDAHTVQRDIEARPDVQSAEALAFQSVYISADRDEYQTVVGVGVTGNGTGTGLQGAFNRSDVHYANGTYTGPMTRAVVLNNDIANELNVSVGDTVYLGGTLATARDQPFTVVAINRRFSVFLGAPTAVVHLGELQQITGTTGSDRASLIGIRLTEDTDAEATADAIEAENPELEVRTQQQQFQAVFENQGPVLASAATLVVVALLTGIALVANTLGVIVYQQRREFAALRALGIRTSTLLSVITVQGLVISTVGVILGLGATLPVADITNRLVADVAGFPNLIKLPLWVLGVGTAVGLTVGVVGALLAGTRLARTDPAVYLRG